MVPIHLKAAELFCFALSFGVKTVDGPSFVHNVRFKLIIQYQKFNQIRY